MSYASWTCCCGFLRISSLMLTLCKVVSSHSSKLHVRKNKFKSRALIPHHFIALNWPASVKTTKTRLAIYDASLKIRFQITDHAPKIKIKLEFTGSRNPILHFYFFSLLSFLLSFYSNHRKNSQHR